MSHKNMLFLPCESPAACVTEAKLNPADLQNKIQLTKTVKASFTSGF